MDSVKKILVAAEELEFTNSVKRHLKREGYCVDSVNNCPDALRKIHSGFNTCRKEFDLTITDSSKNNEFGLKLIHIIKKNYPDISLIVISGFGDIDIVKNVIRSELDDFCQKPLTPRQMIEMIHNIERKRWQLRIINNYQINTIKNNVIHS